MSRLPGEDGEIIQQLLRTGGPGRNVLLYGKSGVDKLNLAQRLVDTAGGVAYTLQDDIPEPDRPAAMLVGQRLLAERSDRRPVLVVPRAQAILRRSRSESFSFFGFGDEDEDTVKSLDEQLLTEAPVPGLWIMSDPGRLNAETLARFLFHAEALRGTRADRTKMINLLIEELPVTDQEKSELAKLEGLSAQQLVSARALAGLTAGPCSAGYARNLLVAATRSQRALARRNKDEVRTSVTHYSVDYINSAGRFGPGQILRALMQRPQGSLCLYGIPGTGKTQFAEHIAAELGKPILVKRASDIFGKYLGESEKQIAGMFDQAEEEDAVLLLDEADSFLRERARSTQHWEVSTVNELLQRMERFDGVFVCTTNLYQQLDLAALRRFTFKLELLPLGLDQRWEMFRREAGLADGVVSEQSRAEMEERLQLMRDLTPGDFATVQRQCRLLGETLTPQQWIEQLEVEVRVKNRAPESDFPLQVTGS
jgi:hypothetical protein